MTKANIAQLAEEQVIGNRPIPEMPPPMIIPTPLLQSLNVLAGVDSDYLDELRESGL